MFFITLYRVLFKDIGCIAGVVALYPPSASRTLLELTSRKLKYYPTHFNAMSVVHHPYLRQFSVEKKKKGVKKRGQSSLAFGNSRKNLAFQIRGGNETKRRRSVNANKS